jgi:hypothetical protein
MTSGMGFDVKEIVPNSFQNLIDIPNYNANFLSPQTLSLLNLLAMWFSKYISN